MPTWDGYNGIVQVGWAGVLRPYLKSTQIFQCPSESTGPSTEPTNSGYSDYAYNVWLGYANGTGSSGLALSAFTQPSLTVVSLDSRGETNEKGTSRAYEDGEPFTTNGAHLAVFNDPAAQPHLEGQNFVFADGHVKWYKGSSPTTSATVYSYSTPGVANGPVPNGCAATGSLASGSSATFNYMP